MKEQRKEEIKIGIGCNEDEVNYKLIAIEDNYPEGHIHYYFNKEI